MLYKTKSKISMLIILVFVLIFLPSCNKKNVEIENTNINNKKSDLNDIIEWSEDNDSNINMEIIELNTSNFITWPDIYGDHVVFANYDISGEERRQIHLFNILTKKDEIIYLNQDSLMIEDTRIGNGWVFWVEGNWNTENTNRGWTIKAYNIQNKQIKTIRSASQLPGRSSLEPRIDNEENMIVWLEGYFDTDDNLKHAIYSYNVNSDEVKKIADVSHVENPYTIIKPRNNTICFADFIDDHWFIRIIELNTMKETTINFGGRFPGSPCSDGRIVAWKQNIKELCYIDLKNLKEEIVIPIRNPFLFDIYDGNIFMSATVNEGKHIYKCDVTDKTITCITKSAEKKNNEFDFKFTNFYADKMVFTSIRALEPIGVKYDLVIVDGIN